MPLFSFVIPVYNIAPYLWECLDSILNQDFESWEAIIVDDGSTDGTGVICDEYAARDSRFRVFHQANAGVSVARNVALDNARGEWIWFVDGDDYIVEGSLSLLAEAVSTKDCDTVLFGLTHLPAWDGDMRENVIAKNIAQSLDDVPKQMYMNIFQTILFNRQILNDHALRFVVGRHFGEDTELQLKYLMLVGKVVQLANRLYVYRSREGSAIRNRKADLYYMQNWQYILFDLISFIKEQHINPAKWSSIFINEQIQSMFASAQNVSKEQRKGLRKILCRLIKEYKAIGFKDIVAPSIRIAMISPDVYFALRRFYYIIVRCKFSLTRRLKRQKSNALPTNQTATSQHE